MSTKNLTKDKLIVALRELQYPYPLIHNIVDPLMETLDKEYGSNETVKELVLKDLSKAIKLFI